MIPIFYFVGEKANSLEEAATILKHSITPKDEGDNAVQQPPKSQKPPTTNPTPSPAESVAEADDTQSAPPLPPAGKNRFPRPLAESEVPQPEPNTRPNTLLRATPIDPKKSKTAQNGN